MNDDDVALYSIETERARLLPPLRFQVLDYLSYQLEVAYNSIGP